MISEQIKENLKNSSWIRAMFEEGEKLSKVHGTKNIFDFTLGNPDSKPPEKVLETLKELISKDLPDLHKYMNNAGFLDVREKIAKYIEKESGIPLCADYILMTCGAAGGLNVVLKTILNPQEEVIIFSPYFGEYIFYIDNHGGRTMVVPTSEETFEPNLDVFESSITKDTKAVLINSPNNPTGCVYSESVLRGMAEIVSCAQSKFNTRIYIISDEPYNKLVYDDTHFPHVFKIFRNSIIVNSFSKSLALPGERIGYIAINGNAEDRYDLFNGMVFANRTLGYVNAPSLFQKVISEVLDETVETDQYKTRRDVLYNHLISLGFKCTKPQGAFYLFPKALIPDDVEFIKKALQYNLLLVPGTGFGCPGYFRIAYCVSLDTIRHSLQAFEKLARAYKL